MYTVVNTAKCNFKCDHCLMCSEPTRKEKMNNQDLELFMALVGGESINLVGGEVFLHPEWEEQLHIILSEQPEMLRIVSNGTSFFTKSGKPTTKFTKFVDILSRYHHNTDIYLLISNDPFHRQELLSKNYSLTPTEMTDMIGEFFQREGVRVELERENREYWQVLPLGRALKTGVCDAKMDTCCYIDIEEEITSIRDIYDLTIDWNGDLFACCNMKFKIGNIKDDESVLLENYHKRVKDYTCNRKCAEC